VALENFIKNNFSLRPGIYKNSGLIRGASSPFGRGVHTCEEGMKEKAQPKKIQIGFTIDRDWVDRVDEHQRRCNGDASWSSYWRQAIRDRMISDGLLKEAHE
jgi:hypothetical protein